METNNIQQQFLQQQQQMNSPFHCKECGISLNSAESLEVHVQYHKENLLKNWAVQATQSTTHNTEEANNNNNVKIKRELISTNNLNTADSSDSMQKKSPDYAGSTPETIFGHPPTPQSYQSASSPYQNQDNSTFTTNFQNYPVKLERTSPTYQTSYPNYNEQQYFQMEPNNQTQQFNQDTFVHKPTYRYHPYNQNQSYDRQQSQQQQQSTSSSSPAVYPPQPTPSPSPKQCDKCGYVCESATQLIEHLNMAHPYQPNQHFLFEHPVVKQEDPQSEILDLDSHKVVFPEEDKRQNGDPPNPHSVSALLNTWSPQQQQKLFQQQDQRIYSENPDTKLFQPHQIHNQEFLPTPSTNQDSQTGNYRQFEHPSTTPVPSNPVPPPNPVGKGANWKSNEARRPKTYNCTACNKWFTSSGHLKRHYNTTLHKNAVKSSGQPDPAGLPISAHHHPAREVAAKQEERPQSGSSGDEIRNDENNSMSSQYDRLGPMVYDRAPPAPNIHHTPPLHSPMPPQLNVPTASPPNGDAGPSTNNLGGLLSLTSPQSINTTNTTPHGFNMQHPTTQHMMSMESNQYQMYPNEHAPHVTQAMATTINNHNITGEYHHQFAVQQQQQQQQQVIVEDNQPLPSFAQIQAHRFNILGYQSANVGGRGAATSPFTNYYPVYKDTELTVVTQLDSSPSSHEEYILGYSPGDHTPEEGDLSMISMNSENETKIMEESKIMSDIQLRLEAQPKSPEKAHIKRDYEEHTPLMSTNNKPGTHKCYDCDKIFNKACYLTQHNKTFHSGDKPFKCTRCGKRFSCEVTYQKHLTKHAGDKPHKCELCPKQFNHKTDLRRHMCLHTGQKPYACDTCGKGFIRKDHMMKHCETHARKTQSKMTALR